MISISVIVPSFKPKEYILECLDSLINQTLDPLSFEIIIVLNGPKEPYWSMLYSYSSNHGNIRLFYEKEPGVSNARNVGIKAAIGEYIAFVDDDDVVSLNYLEGLLKVSSASIIGVSNIHSFTQDIANCSNDFFACKTVQRGKYSRSLFLNRSLLNFPVAKLIHRSMIGDRMFNLHLKNGEDVLFMLQISDKIQGFSFVKSVCYYVRQREGSATKTSLAINEIIRNALWMIRAIIIVYFSSPHCYNILLFLAVIPGIMKGGFVLYKNGRKKNI